MTSQAWAGRQRLSSSAVFLAMGLRDECISSRLNVTSTHPGIICSRKARLHFEALEWVVAELRWHSDALRDTTAKTVGELDLVTVQETVY